MTTILFWVWFGNHTQEGGVTRQVERSENTKTVGVPESQSLNGSLYRDLGGVGLPEEMGVLWVPERNPGRQPDDPHSPTQGLHHPGPILHGYYPRPTRDTSIGLSPSHFSGVFQVLVLVLGTHKKRGVVLKSQSIINVCKIFVPVVRAS